MVQPRLSPGAGLLDAPDHTHARDGMPGTGFGMGELESLVAPLLIRTFDMGSRAAKDEELATGSPVIAVLGTEEDSASDHLRAGQAVAHLLLRATAEGLSASFLNQPNEVPPLRRRLASTIGQAGWPQMLIRFGYGSAGHAHARGCRCAHPRLRARRISTRQGHLHGSRAA